MRFRSLGSGSGGNATVVEAGRGPTARRLLIDAGFSLRELESRLARAELQPTDLHAVFVTHEHGDHIGCAAALADRYALPLWMSRGTWRAIGAPDLSTLRYARDEQGIDLGELQVTPFTVAHDAEEPLQLRCTDGARSLGIVTDVGSATPHLLDQLRGVDALLLECNHDRSMLAASRYPMSLKMRIGGRLGHLSNESAAQVLAACVHTGLNHLVAAHLSQHNNTPALARAALARVWGATDDDVVVADQQSGCGWITLA